MSTVQFTKDDLLGVAKAFSGTPRILAELTRLMRDSRAGLDEVSALLKRDAPLSARIIRIANSASLAQSEPVSSIEAASQMIGVKEIHRIVGIMAIDRMGSDQIATFGLTRQQMRHNSMLVALLMEELAEAAGEDAPTAYAIGLLRPFGIRAFDQLNVDSGGAERFDPAVHPDLGMWEFNTFGTTSPQATSVILDAWRFPAEISKAIRDHRRPEGRHLPLIHLLHIAARMADKLGYGLPCESAFWTDSEEIYRKAGVTHRDSKRQIDRAFVAFDRLCRAMA